MTADKKEEGELAKKATRGKGSGEKKAAAAAKTAAAAKDVSKPHLWGRRAAVSTCMQGGSSVSKPYQRCEVTHGLRIIIRRCVVLVFIPDERGHQIHSAAIHS